MLAADARAEGAPGSGKAAMGREEIVKNMEPILQQIKGNIQEVGGGVSTTTDGYIQELTHHHFPFLSCRPIYRSSRSR